MHRGGNNCTSSTVAVSSGASPVTMDSMSIARHWKLSGGRSMMTSVDKLGARIFDPKAPTSAVCPQGRRLGTRRPAHEGPQQNRVCHTPTYVTRTTPHQQHIIYPETLPRKNRHCGHHAFPLIYFFYGSCNTLRCNLLLLRYLRYCPTMKNVNSASPPTSTPPALAPGT